ncbi:lipopolysaccharide core heptose(II) kinase RfaY [Fusobacterium sp.]|uniref:lipopolysaccharide core heptose(II) kinase RfaY n=1 Tax=Fusobacterium sp. TaxID=68766 RepID=UPI002901EB7B|nr:lipopolysaccharide core heptose(II) kinase RfaY [Fusobacterium sp.]MDU1910874.1 lipopolysaccharide core heptose(II) kinase RfaY [Fusobacterium sp.]
MKKYDLKNINIEEYKIYFYKEKYLEIGRKILNNEYKILEKYKNDNRTFVALIEIENKKYVLKIPKNEYKKTWKRFLTLFKKGEVLLSLINIRSARDRGLREVMDIYLAGEKRKNGMISDSFFLSEYIEGKICLENNKVEKILELTKKMHKLGLYHGDCNPYNFLFTKDGTRIVDTKCKKMLFGNYKAHYDMLTLNKYLKNLKYIYNKNIFYYIALIIKWK